VTHENPSTTSGVTVIMEQLHKAVPSKDGKVLSPIVAFGDALSVARMREARNSRIVEATSVEQLQGLVESPQEFHRVMSRMQVSSCRKMDSHYACFWVFFKDTMDRHYNGFGADEPGTLCHAKLLLLKSSVTSNVSSCVTPVKEFLQVMLTCLFGEL
jgi:hypothetical protein